MRANRSLRLRVALAFALFGGVLSLAQAVLLYFGSRDLGERLIDQTLSAELDDYIARRARNPLSTPENTSTIRAYVVPDQDATVPPAPLLALPIGQHALTLGGIPYRAAVREQAGQRFIVLFNVQQLLQREQAFVVMLTIGVLTMSLLAAVLGYWLAGRVIAPVTDLARRVAGFCPAEHSPPLAAEFPWGEVRELAQAVDDYQARLHAFVERERLFTGDVSHELRTPVAVINGASEILLATLADDSAARPRVERIARAAGDMAEITDALLILAREKTATAPNACDAEAVVRDVVDKLRELYRAKNVAVAIVVDGHPQPRVERVVLLMAFANLLRNAFGFTEQGHIRVLLTANAVSVEDSGIGIDPETLPRVLDRHYRSVHSRGEGIGLSLVQRICERYGWKLDIVSTSGQGTRARLLFADTGPGLRPQDPTSPRNAAE